MFPYHLRGEVEQRRSRRPEHVRCGVFCGQLRPGGVTPFPSRTQRSKCAAGVSLWCGSFWCKNCACLQRERGHVLLKTGAPPLFCLTRLASLVSQPFCCMCGLIGRNGRKQTHRESCKLDVPSGSTTFVCCIVVCSQLLLTHHCNTRTPG